MLKTDSDVKLTPKQAAKKILTNSLNTPSLVATWYPDATEREQAQVVEQITKLRERILKGVLKDA